MIKWIKWVFFIVIQLNSIRTRVFANQIECVHMSETMLDEFRYQFLNKLAKREHICVYYVLIINPFIILTSVNLKTVIYIFTQNLIV